MVSVPTYKRILSYLWPVRLRKSSGTENPVLELFLFRNQYQLATMDALYSDGDRYKPIVAACDYLKHELHEIKSVLVLGTGIASAVRIIERYKGRPKYTLVEHDKTVLEWALELLPSGLHDRVQPVHADAGSYMQKSSKKYKLIVTDIFNGRVVPDFVTETTFLEQCKAGLDDGGIWVLNYIVHKNTDWKKIHRRLGGVFPDNRVINIGINRIVIARV